MKYPTHLSHKPIIGVDDYDKVDDMYAGDAKALTVGFAQYDPNHISAKIWRHNGSEWKRTSEELPLHRVLDLAALIVSLYHPQMPAPLSSYHGTQAPHLPTRIQTDADGNDDMQKLYEYLAENDEYYRPRLKALKTLLNGLNI